MRLRARPFFVLLLLAALFSGCTSTSGGGGSSGSVRCLDRGGSGGHGARTASEEPDRPLLFFFCVQSP
jgi:hypothetical protein